ncbi:MAG TPA: cytochrome P450 [Haliangiales bacterium]|nr:cytochrome P450 [Haliangiales bacterium]
MSRVAPGPRGWEVVSTLLRLRRDPLRSFLAARARWGPCVRVPLGKRTFYLIADPAGARRVLCDNARNYTKDTWSFGLLRGALGEGLLTGDGAVWRAQRRRAQPAFSRARIQALADTVVAHTDYMLAAWPADGDVDVGAEMVRVTLRIMSSAMLGVDVAREVTEISRHLSGVLAYMRDRTASLIGWPRAARRFRAHVAALDGVVDGIIRARRAAPGSRADALSALLEARDEDGSALADDEICAQVKTFLLAGHETTASLLTWTLGLLAAHPAAVDRARTAPDTVFKEALRLYPPLWLVERRATLPDEIGGVSIPAGSPVAVCQWALHRDPAIWPEPERFDPDRFLPAAEAARPRGAYLPFGAGARTCVGEGFAMMLARLVIARVLDAFRLAPAGPLPEPVACVTLRPAAPVRLRVTRHEASRAAVA